MSADEEVTQKRDVNLPEEVKEQEDHVPDMQSLGRLLLSMCTRKGTKGLKSNQPMSALYSHKLQTAITNLVNMKVSQQRLTPDDILGIEFVKQFFDEQATFEEAFGRPLEQYEDLYRQVKLLGEGGYGKVYLSERKSDLKQFASKVQQRSNERDFENFKEELKMLQKLDHPNIVKYYETYIDEKYIYLVMEYIDGGELFEKIA